MPNLDRFYYSALVRVMERRKENHGRGALHLTSMVDWLEGQLVARGIPPDAIRRNALCGTLFRRPADLTVLLDSGAPAYLLVVSQTGSVRKNLNNRRREILADAVNLQMVPGARVAILYLLHADEEARRETGGRRSAIAELDEYLQALLQPQPLFSSPLLQAAALVPATLARDGSVSTVTVSELVRLSPAFFERWLG